ncbi:hypothetical protein ACJIZ3_014635 [Penstemon smallii]|uniref:Homeobox-leucine zipper protein n=1 Tax=Penstemon smallii TaxID=265156 RepID=A0ABD3RME0_9LAMI
MAFVPTAESMFRNHENTHYPTSSSCTPRAYHDMSQFVMRGSISYSGMDRAEELQPEDEMSDEGSQMLGEKKRRLNLEQVKALEKSFELGNKLEPERKIQLARALGLQPRQISIWFQNRRARWKTKQLEKDYDILKRQFEGLKADNNTLKSQNKNLQSQLLALKSRDSSGPINLKKERECSWRENINCDVNLNTTSATDNTLYLHSSHKHAVVFPSTTDGAVAVSLTQFLQSSSRPDHHLQLSHKIDQTPGSNEGYCNMFGGIHEENPEFWTWSEHQNFN